MKRQTKRRITDEKGMATIETIPLLVVFLVFVAYGMGLFGTVHSAILNSIAARTYAFETFRNRSHLVVYRDYDPGPISHYGNHQMRFHGVQAEQHLDNQYGNFTATARPISVGLPLPEVDLSQADHNIKIFELKTRNREVSAHPVWVKVAYGICLNAACGDTGGTTP